MKNTQKSLEEFNATTGDASRRRKIHKKPKKYPTQKNQINISHDKTEVKVGFSHS